ncbi:MAG: TldD/PmbA family protein [Chloroflexi bacterium]|nr:TldD/PmbA family protein [Chloroflexota bacterium]
MYEAVLERATRVAEQAELFVVRSEETPVDFEANRLKRMETSESSGVALRIVKDGRVGLAATTDLARLDTLLDDALATAAFGPTAHFDLPGPQSFPDVSVYDPAVEQLPVERLVEIGEELIDLLREHTPEIQCEVGLSKQVARVDLLNNRGLQASFAKSIVGVSLMGLLVRGTDMLYVGESAVACRPIEDYRRLVDTACRQIEMAKRNVTPPTRPLPIVFTPRGVASVFVMPLATALNGRTVYQGASPLGNRRGELVFDEQISLWDDGSLPLRPASGPFDEEGIPTRRTTLIDRGVVQAFVYDLQTAGLAGTTSTGNGERSLDTLPHPSTSTLVLGTGDGSFDEMVRDMRQGLIVEHLIGAAMGNVLGGEFGGNVLLGYLVENGEVVGRVKNTMIAGNVYEVLKNVIAVGREAQWVGGSLSTPHLYVGSVGVASKE